MPTQVPVVLRMRRARRARGLRLPSLPLALHTSSPRAHCTRTHLRKRSTRPCRPLVPPALLTKLTPPVASPAQLVCAGLRLSHCPTSLDRTAAMLQQTPLLALLRRLEAQNIWRMSHTVLSAQQYSAAAAVEATRGKQSRVLGGRRRKWLLLPPGSAPARGLTAAAVWRPSSPAAHAYQTTFACWAAFIRGTVARRTQPATRTCLAPALHLQSRPRRLLSGMTTLPSALRML